MMFNSLERRGHTPNKVIHDAVSECIALEMPHQPCSCLAFEMGSCHGFLHRVVREQAWSSNLVKLHQPSATCKPIPMLWQPMGPISGGGRWEISLRAGSRHCWFVQPRIEKCFCHAWGRSYSLLCMPMPVSHVV